MATVKDRDNISYMNMKLPSLPYLQEGPEPCDRLQSEQTDVCDSQWRTLAAGQLIL